MPSSSLRNLRISYFFFFLRRITVPPTPAIPTPASRIQKRIGVLSPVFGEVDVFVVSVSFVSGVAVVSGVSAGVSVGVSVGVDYQINC